MQLGHGQLGPVAVLGRGGHLGEVLGPLGAWARSVGGLGASEASGALGAGAPVRLTLGLRSPAAPAEPDEAIDRIVTEGRQPSCSSMKPSKRPAGERGVHSSSKGGPPGGGRRKCGRRARPCSRELLTVEAQLTRPNLQKKVASGSRRLFAEPWRTLWPPAEPRNAVRVAAGCRHGLAAVDCREALREAAERAFFAFFPLTKPTIYLRKRASVAVVKKISAGLIYFSCAAS